MYTFKSNYIYIYIYIHTHTHTHTHTHIYNIVYLGSKSISKLVLLKTMEYFLFRIFIWIYSSLIIFLMSGSRRWRKYPILAQALLIISLVILRSCLIVCCCELLNLFGMGFFLFFFNIYLVHSVRKGSTVGYWKKTHSNNQTQPLRMTCKIVKSAWACIGHFLHHPHLDIMKIRLEPFHLKILKKKKILHDLQQNMFKLYIYIYIYIYISLRKNKNQSH